MDKHEALDWFLRRKSMYLDDKCQAAEDIAIECIIYHLTGPELRSAIEEAPTVPAVPLDKLCEWLAGYAEPPMDALTICDNLFEAWKMTLTGLMEEQDVDRQ